MRYPQGTRSDVAVRLAAHGPPAPQPPSRARPRRSTGPVAGVSSVPTMDGSIVRRPPFGSNPLVGERGSDTQRRILGAALEVFAVHGFAEARVELITEKAGCSRPAV